MGFPFGSSLVQARTRTRTQTRPRAPSRPHIAVQQEKRQDGANTAVTVAAVATEVVTVVETQSVLQLVDSTGIASFSTIIDSQTATLPAATMDVLAPNSPTPSATVPEITPTAVSVLLSTPTPTLTEPLVPGTTDPTTGTATTADASATTAVSTAVTPTPDTPTTAGDEANTSSLTMTTAIAPIIASSPTTQLGTSAPTSVISAPSAPSSPAGSTVGSMQESTPSSTPVSAVNSVQTTLSPSLPSPTAAASSITSTRSSNSTWTTTHTSSSTTTEFFLLPSSDNGGDGGWGGGGGNPAATDSVSNNPSATDGALPGLTSKAVGGIVGGIAGLVLLLLLAGLLFRWKKRRTTHALPSGESGTTGSRGFLGGGGSGNGSTAAAAGAGDRASQMSQRRSSPFAIPAALARLSGQGPKDASPPTGERGFYKVSGRKLPSVLEAGGDGYSDPRESVMTGTSTANYRVSTIGFGESGPVRFALGSPMRPVSGVLQMRPGPARTLVTAENPFVDPEPSAPPPYARYSQHAEPVSSRFTETM